MAGAARRSAKISEDCVMVFITAPSFEAAEKIARGLLDEKLVACANMTTGVHSLFWWEGKIDKADESLIICKTMKSLVEKVTKFVREHHEYKVPEIIAIPVIGGNPEYLKWIKESTVE